VEPNRSPPLGSIADVRQRLVLWCERSESGLARVEFSSEGARRRVVADLREDLAARGIVLHEITLQTVADAAALATDLLARLATLAPGAVSIDGFASALPLDSAQRRAALYRFNLKREPLGEQPQRQIWWLPPHLAEEFIRAVPDLDSWFLVKLQLSEIAEINGIAEAAAGDRPSARERGAIDTRLGPSELRSLAAATIERLQRGRQQGLVQAVAQDLLLRALANDEASFGDAHPNFAIRLKNLAQLLQATNRLAEAEPLMRRALAIDEASFGDAHPNVARDLKNLAQLLQATNRPAEAEPLMRRALAIDEASFGDAHPDVARDLNNLAQLLQHTNRLAEAEPLLRRALAIDEANFGDAHPNVAIRLNNLARLLQDTSRLAEAEPLLRRALAIDEASFGDAHPDVARDLNNLAQLLQRTNRLAEAEPLLRRALAIDEASFGDAHPNVAIDLNNLAQLLQDTDRLVEAEPLQRRALRVLVASIGSEHPNSQEARANTVALLRATGRSDDEIADCLARDLGARPGGDS
jgi:predicted component of type VI protein secretion system